MSENLINVLNVISLPRIEILQLLKPVDKKIIYFDSDSEDGGTEVVEIIFLKLCLELLAFKAIEMKIFSFNYMR